MVNTIQIQNTPNPNALKFVLDMPVKSNGSVTYKQADQCVNNMLAENLFAIKHIQELYFFDNFITVTQDGQGNWDDLTQEIQGIILTQLPKHNPDFSDASSDTAINDQAVLTDDLTKINKILDETIRPALQRDGGDLQVLEFSNNILKIFYQGACGSCPHAAMGTLMAIENVLKEQYDPNITVSLG